MRNISSRELAEWKAYYSIEPFGEYQEEFRAAIIASTVANTSRDPEKRLEPFSPEDFMPNFARLKQMVESLSIGDDEKPESEPKWMKIKRKVEQWNAALGGKDLR